MNRLSVCIVALLFAVGTASSNDRDGSENAVVRRRQAMEQGCYSQDEMNEKQATTVEELKWPGGILPYEISKDFSPKDVEMIKEGISWITSQTCIKFVERNSDHTHYVQVVDGKGCSSSLGRKMPGQPLKLNRTGCMDPLSVAHEFYHALGMSHEQSRNDRDDYVDIIWNNIQEGHKHNFNKAPLTTTFGLPYDFDSIMHYLSNAFAIDENKPTLVSKVPGKEVQQNYEERLSPLDIQKMKKLYNCQ